MRRVWLRIIERVRFHLVTARGARFAGAALILLVVWSVLGAAGAGARGASPRGHARDCGVAVRRASHASRGVPVLFVHGFAGAPSDFRRRRGGWPSMLIAVRDLRGVVVYTFDYSAHALDWVTSPSIGPELGRAIVCLAKVHSAPVIVVAHSMGGLAVREAQGQVVTGASVAASLGAVITIGTPFEGTQLLGFADGPGGDVLAGVLETALRACGSNVSLRPRRTPCDLLGATDTAAVQGMIPGSERLRALPPWSSAVRIVPMAAEIEAGIDGPFGFSEQISLGDFAVSVDSALADASRGSRTFVAGCHASLLGLVSAVDASLCSHANELANRRIIKQVRDRVERAVARASSQVGVVKRPSSP